MDKITATNFEVKPIEDSISDLFVNRETSIIKGIKLMKMERVGHKLLLLEAYLCDEKMVICSDNVKEELTLDTWEDTNNNNNNKIM